MKKNLIMLLVLVILGGIAYWLYGTQTNSTLDQNVFTHFSIEDTASVSKIVIVDKITGSVTLTRNREKGIWLLDGKHRAKDRSVEICLEAIKNLEIKGNVSKNQQKTIISNAAGAGKKIEIYTDNDKVPEKIWISAGNTPDHHGDYFILQLPEKGISPEAFMVDIPMFAGYVTARFHTEYNDWRYSGIFNHPKLDFKNITVEEKASPENSFSIDWDGKEKFEISNPNSGSQIKNINYTNTKDYLIRYKKIHLETFTLHLSEMQRDSVLNRVPDWKITVTDLEDKKKTLSLFYLPSKGNYQDFDGNDLPYNLDLMYATLGDGELFRVQYEFVIKALLEPYSFFEL